MWRSRFPQGWKCNVLQFGAPLELSTASHDGIVYGSRKHWLAPSPVTRLCPPTTKNRRDANRDRYATERARNVRADGARWPPGSKAEWILSEEVRRRRSRWPTWRDTDSVRDRSAGARATTLSRRAFRSSGTRRVNVTDSQDICREKSDRITAGPLWHLNYKKNSKLKLIK